LIRAPSCAPGSQCQQSGYAAAVPGCLGPFRRTRAGRVGSRSHFPWRAHHTMALAVFLVLNWHNGVPERAGNAIRRPRGDDLRMVGVFLPCHRASPPTWTPDFSRPDGRDPTILALSRRVPGTHCAPEIGHSPVFHDRAGIRADSPASSRQPRSRWCRCCIRPKHQNFAAEGHFWHIPDKDREPLFRSVSRTALHARGTANPVFGDVIQQ